MGLGYCLGVIDKINQSEIARRDVQKMLCSTILPNYDDFELFFKGDILRLADVFGIAKEEPKKMLVFLLHSKMIPTKILLVNAWLFLYIKFMQDNGF